MRAMWKGVIELEDLSVPVKLYSAANDHSIHFRLLHEKDLSPVKQKMINPSNGEEVEWEQIVRGYEVRPGKMVTFEKEELEELEPESSRSIEVVQFVNPEEIDHRWYERPYFLGPDEELQAYRDLHAALLKEEMEGVVRWTMRKKGYVGALRALEEGLALMTLRNRNEVVVAADLPRPEGRQFSKKEREMASTLIESLSGDLDLSEWEDEYRKRVLELVETKRQGGSVKLKKFRKKKTDDESLTDSLEASIAALKKGA